MVHKNLKQNVSHFMQTLFTLITTKIYDDDLSCTSPSWRVNTSTTEPSETHRGWINLWCIWSVLKQSHLRSINKLLVWSRELNTYNWFSILCISSLMWLVDEPQGSKSLFPLSSLSEMLSGSSVSLVFIDWPLCLREPRGSVENGVAIWQRKYVLTVW